MAACGCVYTHPHVCGSCLERDPSSLLRTGRSPVTISIDTRRRRSVSHRSWMHENSARDTVHTSKTSLIVSCDVYTFCQQNQLEKESAQFTRSTSCVRSLVSLGNCMQLHIILQEDAYAHRTVRLTVAKTDMTFLLCTGAADGFAAGRYPVPDTGYVDTGGTAVSLCVSPAVLSASPGGSVLVTHKEPSCVAVDFRRCVYVFGRMCRASASIVTTKRSSSACSEPLPIMDADHSPTSQPATRRSASVP